MKECEIKNLIETTLTQKIDENEKFIKYTFYELKVIYNLKPIDKFSFLKLLSIKLENNNYDIYTYGMEYIYNNQIKKVQKNEELIAIKR